MGSFFFLSFWCDLKTNCCFLNLNLKKLEENSFFKHTKIKKILMGGGHTLPNPPPARETRAVAALQPMDSPLIVFILFGPPCRKAGSATDKASLELAENIHTLFMSSF